mgnify:CR=1 FL=1
MSTTPAAPESAPVQGFAQCHVGIVSHLEELAGPEQRARHAPLGARGLPQYCMRPMVAERAAGA